MRDAVAGPRCDLGDHLIIHSGGWSAGAGVLHDKWYVRGIGEVKELAVRGAPEGLSLVDFDEGDD